MHEMTRWLDRRFAYEPPVGEYPMIVERVRGTPARIVDRVTRCRSDALLQTHGDAWSMQEHIGHLLDLETLWMARVEEFLGEATELSAADMSNRKTLDAHHNQRAIAAIVAEFSVARSRLVSRLDTAPGDAIAKTALHPRLKRPMRLIDLCFFVAEHDDHHLAIVTRLAYEPGR